MAADEEDEELRRALAMSMEPAPATIGQAVSAADDEDAQVAAAIAASLQQPAEADAELQAAIAMSMEGSAPAPPEPATEDTPLLNAEPDAVSLRSMLLGDASPLVEQQARGRAARAPAAVPQWPRAAALARARDACQPV